MKILGFENIFRGKTLLQFKIGTLNDTDIVQIRFLQNQARVCDNQEQILRRFMEYTSLV